jgi:ribose 5-phosphate isomerase B
MDYPPIAAAAAREVVEQKHEVGILICGTGIGMSIASSKVPGAIVGLCTNEYMAKMARAHNNANILCIGSRVIGVNLAYEIADAFLATPFEGGRHERRYNKILEIEGEYLREQP